MTTEYATKEQALEMGAYYAGYTTDEDRHRVIAEATIDSMVLGWPHDKVLESYEIPNKDGVRVRLGISQFREGYDLWLISPEGFARRT